MQTTAILNEYTKNFQRRNGRSGRSIGLECEFPIVDKSGICVDHEIVKGLFGYLEKEGFNLKWDQSGEHLIGAERINKQSLENGTYCKDMITTDLGVGTLEIAMAPQGNLFIVQEQLAYLLDLILTYLDTQDCRLLGYGIQPLTSPSKDLLIPHKRYNFRDRVSGNHFVTKSAGKDFHLLTITASNQCHMEVSLKEMIPAMNVLNGLSGLQIALQANSPIWKGRIGPYKATRELFWDYCFTDRLNQAGIPPKFENIEQYVENLMHFKAQRVIRDGQPYRIIREQTCKAFLNNKRGTMAEDCFGRQMLIEPQLKDIHIQNGFCYYNARLVSKFGTIENRMACQQPPEETMVTAALTLGILRNLDTAHELMETLHFISPEQLRTYTIKNALKGKLGGRSIIFWLYRLLDIAKKGLQKRELGEEVFLAPLYTRLEKRESPADSAVSLFQKEGMKALLEKLSFKKANLNNRNLQTESQGLTMV